MSEKIMVIEAGETALTRKFIFCQGIPASGKSTWAKEWVGQNEYSRVRINRDDIRNMLGVYWLKDPVARAHRENYITQIERAAIKNALMARLLELSPNTAVYKEAVTVPKYPHFFIHLISVSDEEDRKNYHLLTYSFPFLVLTGLFGANLVIINLKFLASSLFFFFSVYVANKPNSFKILVALFGPSLFG